MPFSHNDFYHPLLLRNVPSGARTALDVGCGTGAFARRLAASGLAVDAVDQAEAVIDLARAHGVPGTGTITYRRASITELDIPPQKYDFISCIASLHHVPFSTVTDLRRALRPGGVLAIVGLAKPRSPADWLMWTVLGPSLNLAARGVVAAGERLNGGAQPSVQAPIRDWDLTMAEVRRESSTLLPGRSVRPLVFWRYLLTYRELPGQPAR